MIVQFELASCLVPTSLVSNNKGLKMNRLKRIGPIMGILQGQQELGSCSRPFRSVRLKQ